MRHLDEHQLVALVFDGPNARAELRNHVRSCDQCRASVELVGKAAQMMQPAGIIPAPPGGWLKLRGRILAHQPEARNRREPFWPGVVIGHIAAIFLAVAVFAIVGEWLESAAVWNRISAAPVVRSLGSRGLVAASFFIGGSLLALALAPVLWWESRRPGKRAL